MTIRYLGNCPVCEGDFKLRDGKLVHHGYQRPGDGFIHGDCFAVGMELYEVSAHACELFRNEMQSLLITQQQRLSALTDDDIKELMVMHYVQGDHKMTFIKKGEKDFDVHLNSQIYKQEQLIHQTMNIIDRMDRRIALG